MIQRVMPDLMGLKNVLVINDEAHHCYREKPGEADEEELKGDDKEEAQKNKEAARLWISGLEAVNRHIGLTQVVDLSATPFFLRGSGYAEGTLFPWTTEMTPSGILVEARPGKRELRFAHLVRFSP